MSFLEEVSAVPKAVKIAGAFLIFLAIIGGYILYLRWRVEVSERQAVTANRETQNAKSETNALKILVNANTNLAKEVEDEKKTANTQAINSSIAFNNLNNSILRDSNTFAGNFAEAHARFCQSFPLDSACR